ncbi:MAG: 4-hydroxy-tetrahydrodipicolinate reductase [Geminicoccales bacterium]
MKVGIVGCAGRMGQMLVRTVAASDRCLVVGGSERSGASVVGKDLGLVAGIDALGVSVTDDPSDLFAHADAVLEFTSPSATVQHAEIAAKKKKIHVVGTTGFESPQLAALNRAAKHTAIVLAPNMSVGVNLLLRMVQQMAHALDTEWDIEVLEMHHRGKVDAPSGTALALGRAAAAGRDVDLDHVAKRVRDGITGARRRGDIGFAVLRGGDVVSDHRVIFAIDGERVELSHVATNREIYARGALRAALWAQGRPPGLYTMADVLGLTG